MRYHPNTLSVAAVLVVQSLTLAASADPSGADKAVADALFRKGRELMEAGQVSAACGSFSESQRLDPQIGTLINLAICHERDNKTASAYGEYSEAAGLAARAKQTDRERFARSQAEAIEKRLSRLLLAGPAEPGLTITLDGKALSASVIGAPLPLDPGEHVIFADAPGKRRWEHKLEVPVGPATVTVTIPPLEIMTPPVVAPPVVAPPVVAPPPPPDIVSGPDPKRVAGAVLTGAGGVGLVIGAVFGGLAFSRESDANKACPSTTCPSQAGLDLHNSASRSATTSTVAFVAGGVVAATGVVLLALSRGGDKPAPRAFVTPLLGPAQGGLVFGGAF